MPIRFGKNAVTMEAACTVEEALPLLEYLQAHPNAKVALRACTDLHSAVILVLMAARPKVASVPDEPFLKRWVGPVLKPERP